MPHDHACTGPDCGCRTAPALRDPNVPIAQPVRPWRPSAAIKVKALGIFRRDDQILAAPVHDDSGHIKGWRPLGGTVEFGESATDTLIREFREETEQEITDITQLGVLENHFSHHGAQGHEVIFVFAARFAEPAIYEADQLAFKEGDQPCEAKWISLAKAEAGRLALYPDGLAALLRAAESRA